MRIYKLLDVIATTLAVSTLWLALELHQARREVAELRGAAAGAPAGAPASQNAEAKARGNQAAPPATASPPESSTKATTSDDDAPTRAATFAHNAWVRTWLDDPAKRAKVYADMRRAQEHDAPRKLLDVDEDNYNRFLDSQAEGGLRHAEAMYRCNTDPHCDMQAAIAEQAQLRQRELAEVSLGEERRHIVNEWQQRGEQIAGLANAWGTLTYPKMKNIEERTMEATEFQRRQRGRAAAF